MARRVIVIATAAASLVGCQTTMRYTKSGATQEQFLHDRYECMVQAKGGTLPNCKIWQACLADRGYVLDMKHGDLVVPDELRAQCWAGN